MTPLTEPLDSPSIVGHVKGHTGWIRQFSRLLFAMQGRGVAIPSPRCDRLVTAPEFAELEKGSLVITGSRGEPVRRQNVFLGMPNKRIRRYLIDIKDAKGQSVFFTAADWSDEERRAAITQILRLDGVPDVYDFSEPKLKPKRGKE